MLFIIISCLKNAYSILLVFPRKCIDKFICYRFKFAGINAAKDGSYSYILQPTELFKERVSEVLSFGQLDVAPMRYNDERQNVFALSQTSLIGHFQCLNVYFTLLLNSILYCKVRTSD
jgi:hypothetical protein